MPRSYMDLQVLLHDILACSFTETIEKWWLYGSRLVGIPLLGLLSANFFGFASDASTVVTQTPGGAQQPSPTHFTDGKYGVRDSTNGRTEDELPLRKEQKKRTCYYLCVVNQSCSVAVCDAIS